MSRNLKRARFIRADHSNTDETRYRKSDDLIDKQSLEFVERINDYNKKMSNLEF